ncbi:flagellar M-ring protein [Halopseudomonas pertucinogena]|uniref:Flagellar M-ring protein n=2 Tax=Halopseudomonas pertucinogena TaxID=86175 RepID=A0ABQ2CQ97_9GAMM|nr:flagellar basal-body MS-ring/collar protein FliF [Halopseudomonas pertucinogena]GGI98533.1 flagellar M-ring protein [Halopseudomonas pertucinogena]
MDAATPNTPATRPEAPLPDAPRKPLPGLGFLENLSKLPMMRQFALLVGLAASVAIGFAVVLWSQQPEYRPLYGSMENLNAAQVVEVLQQSRIRYKVEPNSGALLVRSEDLADARLRLASAGVVQGDGNVGFEILDRERGLGTSQFMEATQYRRGLEGEMARTISSLYNVKAARVHIAMPRSTVFVRDDRKPSASVLLELYAGRTLEPAQVMAIVNLVATSVPELSKDQVTVVDQHGNLLSDQDELNELTIAGRQFDHTRRLEDTYARRVHSILQPVLGSGNYKAEVSADVDFSTMESTAESFNPEAALRSEQVLTEQRVAGQGPVGIPGALSNQPPGTTQVPEQVIDPETGEPVVAAPPRDSREQATRNFELDRKISYTRQQQGRLARLSVAVVVDNRQEVNPETGEVTRVPLSEAELANLTQLVRDAVGYDQARGDSVSVVNSAFVPADGMQMEVPEIPFWTQPWFWDIAKQILGILFVLVLVFGVLRPVLKSIGGGSRQSTDSENYPALSEDPLLADDLRDDTVSLSGPASSTVLLPPPGAGYEQQLNAIKGLLAEDPGRVAQVVKEWINSDE